MNRWHKTFSYCSSDVKSRGAPKCPQKTPPHSLRRATVARSTRWSVRLSSRSLSAASSSSSAAPPVSSDSLRWTGYMLYLRSPAPGRRRRRAGGVLPVEDGYQAGHAGVCSAPHRHPHVAPRSATTLASEWCTCAEQGARPSPSLLEPARTTQRSEPSRFSAWESVSGSWSITSASMVHRGAAMGAVRPCSGPCAAPGRPPRGQSGHRASRPNPAGRPWANGGASTVRTELRARLARKVNVCVPTTHATSRGASSALGHVRVLVCRVPRTS